jgi:hypothetical protein
MNIEEIRNYCLTKPGISEGFPFGDIALLYHPEVSWGISLKSPLPGTLTRIL